MDQDATWYGDKPRPGRRRVRWGRSSPVKGAQPSSFRFMSIVTKHLGTEVDLGPGHIVLDGYPAPPRNGQSIPPPLFGLCLL